MSKRIQNKKQGKVELNPPPDGGYGWTIVAVAFTNNFISNGILFSLGNFLDVLVEVERFILICHLYLLNRLNLFLQSFEASYKDLAFSNSLLFGCYAGMGPVSRYIAMSVESFLFI